MFRVKDLEPEQLENIVELIQGPVSIRYSRYEKTEDHHGDKILDSLILWVDLIINEIAEMHSFDEKPDIYWSQRGDFPPMTKTKQFDGVCYNLFALSEILVDLRRCSTNRYINRSIKNTNRGRRSDHPNYKLLKDEVGKVYNLLRLFSVSSNDACDAINCALQTSGIPLMSNDNIKKRASKNKSFPYSKLIFRDKDSEDEYGLSLTGEHLIYLKSSKELQKAIAIIALEEFILDMRQVL